MKKEFLFHPAFSSSTLSSSHPFSSSLSDCCVCIPFAPWSVPWLESLVLRVAMSGISGIFKKWNLMGNHEVSWGAALGRDPFCRVSFSCVLMPSTMGSLPSQPVASTCFWISWTKWTSFLYKISLPQVHHYSNRKETATVMLSPRGESLFTWLQVWIIPLSASLAVPDQEMWTVGLASLTSLVWLFNYQMVFFPVGSWLCLPAVLLWSILSAVITLKVCVNGVSRFTQFSFFLLLSSSQNRNLSPRKQSPNLKKTHLSHHIILCRLFFWLNTVIAMWYKYENRDSMFKILRHPGHRIQSQHIKIICISICWKTITGYRYVKSSTYNSTERHEILSCKPVNMFITHTLLR